MQTMFIYFSVCASLSLSVSLSFSELFVDWLEAAKRGKKVNDSLPCLFLIVVVVLSFLLADHLSGDFLSIANCFL